MSCIASTSFATPGSSNLGLIGANDPINDFIPDPSTFCFIQGLSSSLASSSRSMGSPLEGLSSSLASSNRSIGSPLEALSYSPQAPSNHSMESPPEVHPPSPIGSGRPPTGSRTEVRPPSPIGSGRPSIGSRLEVQPPSPIGSGRRSIGPRSEALTYSAVASGCCFMDSPLEDIPCSSTCDLPSMNGLGVSSTQALAPSLDRRTMELSLEALFHNVVTLSSRSMESSLEVSRSPHSMGYSCHKHGQPHSLFCRTCHIPACTECITEEHNGHQFMYIQDAIHSARETNHKLHVEARQTIGIIKNAIENIKRVYENVEQRSITAVTETKKLIRSYMNALNNREAELLQNIDKTRQIKGRLLTSQLENLSHVLTELMRISNLLNESSKINNTIDLLKLNDTATNEMRQLRAVRPELTPCEDDDVLFLPPDNTVFRLLSTIGGIGINNSSRILNNGANTQNKVFLTIPRRVTEVQPMSQTIYGANHIAVEHNPVPSLVFGSEGKEDGELCRPWGVCCDFMGHIVVTDRSNNRIQVFSPKGIFLYKFGRQGTGPGEFDRPAGITINPRGHIVVADKDNHRIQVFKMDGTFVSMFGEKGVEHGQFNYPWDVACNKQGHVVVSDTRNHRIQIFDSNGRFLRKYGYEVNTYRWKIFDTPRGVCFAPNGNIIVTDFNNHKLIVINERTNEVQYVGKEGSGYEQFLRPQGIVCDDNGKIIVADSRNNRIQVLDLSGNFCWAVGSFGTGAGQLDRPSGICLNPDGRITVVDFANSRVQMF
ncbi:E3 ubiquitin-protein ligase TRIM71 isoform X2 [Diorhabda carinulata]|uniref:E3 ubiquitin-protein ligase TRIM71 isoform X2 n=1 Tax=Diorhabda carinulata TaxID=1163345 RepID=UPI0025A27905|nr:E3 ubiquitin-protein ligase TRIM71 isoform X2 [Diorhabda carinulata]